MSSILGGVGTNAEEEGINLANISSILGGAGINAAKAFKDLYDLWFDTEGNKTHYLKTLENERMNLVNMSSILHRARANAAKAFRELYNAFFDKQGNKTQYLKTLEKEGINISNMSSILGGAGANAAKAFKNLYDLWFDDQGNKKHQLKHFTDKKDGGKKFYGFRPSYLCSILSAAVDDLEKFHDFCFTGKTKKYLNHFLREGFTPKNLSNILHGSRANICSAFKDFHDVCFDKKGNKTQILDDFYNAGFSLSDLSCVLTMAGNNASFILTEELFTPKNLSKILYGVGINIYPILEILHDLCFDKTGEKTQYFSDLINVNHKPTKLFRILRKATAASIPLVEDY
ncbi:hypothetical protein Avbf_03497 [Armadillidium vulgare]|nr:hypothetical protein Avbf_03497 [Armadillidium vulgare]